MKKYIASTDVSVNVVLPNGKNVHIDFSPLSVKGSVYYTDDPEIQAALERHYKYGRLFKAAEVTFARGDKSDGSDMSDETEKSEKTCLTIVEVNDPEEAKDYLCEKFGTVRTKLKTLKNIKATAELHGIEFKGI